MADPLSVTASIIAVIQAGSAIVTYIKDVHDAPKESKRLLLDVQYVQGVLEMLKDTITAAQRTAAWASTLSVLAVAGNPLEVLQSTYQTLESKLEKAAGKTGLSRAVTSLLWPFTTKQTGELHSLIERQKTLLLVALDNDHILLSTEIKKDTAAIRNDLQHLSGDVTQLTASVAKIDISAKDQASFAALAWLSTLRYDAAKDEILQRRGHGSLQWFFTQAEFTSWIAGHHKTLLCSGMPGAGKTVLAAAIIDHLQTVHQNTDTGLAWVFCTFKQRHTQTPLQVLASIAAQLAGQREDLATFVTSLKGSQSTDVTIHEVRQVLQRCTNSFQRIFVVIDALDEFSSVVEGWNDLLQQLLISDLDASFVFTARPFVSVNSSDFDAITVQIAADQDDVRAYIRQELARKEFSRHVAADAQLQTHIEDELLQRNRGMFLLTRFHVDAIRAKVRYGKKALRVAVDSLPKKLYTTYDLTIQRVMAQDSDDVQVAKEVLAWVYYSVGTLSIQVLQQAIACQRREDVYDSDDYIDPDFLVAVCAGLVVCNYDSRLVELAHPTVAEYLDRLLPDIYPAGRFEVHSTCVRHFRDSGVLRLVDDIGIYLGDCRFWYDELTDFREAFEQQYRAELQRCSFSRYAEHHTNVLNGPYPEFRSAFPKLHFACNMILEDCGRTENATQDLPLAIFLNDIEAVKTLIATYTTSDVYNAVTLSSWLAYSIMRGNDAISYVLLHAAPDLEASHTIRRARIGQFDRDDKGDCFYVALKASNEALLAAMRAHLAARRNK